MQQILSSDDSKKGDTMVSIYKNGKYYYLSVSHDGKKISKSLGTNRYYIAKLLKLTVEKAIIMELIGIQ